MQDIAVCVQNSNKNVTSMETVDAISKAGYKNVFVQYYHRELDGYSELDVIDYCREVGLNIIFCHLGYRDINEIWLEGELGDKVVDEYIEDLNVMKEKDINMVVMHLTTHPIAPPYNEVGLERVKKIVEHAKKIGIKIAFENTRKPGFLEFVLGKIKEDNIGVCFDIGHYHCHFHDKFDFEFFKNRFFAVHLHDNDEMSDRHWLPFEGTVDWEGTFAKLKASGYNGPMTLELCYRNDYLKNTVYEFYKESYQIGKKLAEMYENI